MKKTLSAVSKGLCAAFLIVIFFFGKDIGRILLPDVTGEIKTQSKIIEQKLESSQRLEVTTVDEEGLLQADTNVIIFGTVGSTTIRYRYTASIGIDLQNVVMTVDSDRIVFMLPETEILNDGIEALEINRNNFFSKRIDKSVETLLSEQREKCREQYLNDKQYSQKTKEDTVKAFSQTVCQWLESSGERHYEFEILYPDQQITK